MPRRDGATASEGRGNPQVSKLVSRSRRAGRFGRDFGFSPKALLRHLQKMDAAASASRN